MCTQIVSYCTNPPHTRQLFSPTLIWLGPRLGNGREQSFLAMEDGKDSTAPHTRPTNTVRTCSTHPSHWHSTYLLHTPGPLTQYVPAPHTRPTDTVRTCSTHPAHWHSTYLLHTPCPLTQYVPAPHTRPTDTVRTCSTHPAHWHSTYLLHTPGPLTQYVPAPHTRPSCMCIDTIHVNDLAWGASYACILLVKLTPFHKACLTVFQSKELRRVFHSKLP